MSASAANRRRAGFEEAGMEVRATREELNRAGQALVSALESWMDKGIAHARAKEWLATFGIGPGNE